jgi:flagellar protein FlaJ
MKVNYGTSVSDAFSESNNAYRVPRLARTVRLITDAQAASNQLRAVLSTAAKTSENQDDIERDRKARTRMQIVVILMSFLTLLGVMAILQTQFLESMGDLATQSGSSASADTPGDQSFGGDVDTALVSLLFFHAVTIHAVTSGFISGYIRDGTLLSGAKYVVSLLAISLVVWAVVV